MSLTTGTPADRVKPAGALPEAPRAGRANNFNLIRLGLATLVILAHSPELADGDRHREILTRLGGAVSLGEVAVDGFFVLSGYLILMSWRRDPSVPRFLGRRARRIYPGFLAASLVSALIVGPLGAPAGYFAGLNWPKFAVEALKLQPPLIPPVFEGQPHPLVNGSMWTIAYEFRCYVLVALLGAIGLAGRRARWLALGAIGLVGMLGFGWSETVPVRKAVHLLIGQPEILGRFVAFYAAGAGFALARDRIPLRASWAAVAAGLLAPALLHPLTAQVGLLTLGSYLLFWFAFAPTPRLAWFRSAPDISYGVYLYGWPIQKLLLWYYPALSPWALFPLALAIAAGSGWLSWTLVERPWLPAGRREAREDRPRLIRAAPAG